MQSEESLRQENLRQENDDLKRQLQELRAASNGSSHSHGGSSSAPTHFWHPSNVTIWAIVLGVTVLVVIAFFAGYVPLQKRRALIVAEAHEQEQALPRVEVIPVHRGSRQSNLELPGNIEAVTEAPILGRADGYVLRRMADIGDRVRAGQPLAEIDAPELDDQVRQAHANGQQAQAALEQALANYEQGKTNLELARVTAQRWNSLAERGVVSKQENDQFQAQHASQAANLHALEKAVAAQRSNVAASEANGSRLDKMQAYRVVKAPFDGVITQRNVDAGALVNAGSTLLFRIAQTGTLRIYVNVPQTNASSIKPGQPAQLIVSNLPGRIFTGTIARTANVLDPSSRTLLVEVHVSNADNALLPGMYAQVDLGSASTYQPLLVPSDALVSRGDGTEVAVVRADHTVHLQKIQVGRDYGDHLEVTGGLQDGDTIIPNPGDLASEGLKVNPVPRPNP